MMDRYIDKIKFAIANRELVEAGKMKAVLVRDRTADDIDPMLELRAAGAVFGHGWVTKVTPVVGYGNGLFKIGPQGKMVDKRTARRLLRDLGLDRDGFNEVTKVMPLNGVVVWFAYQPLEVQEVA